jgi:Peptidase family U32
VSVLDSLGLPAGDLGELPSSVKRFPDGASYRVEIPSTEGPGCLRAVVEEAARLGVPVQRVSQGTGVGLLTTDELREMAALGREHDIEVCLFARPNAAWGLSVSSRAAAGGTLAPAAWGMEQVVQQLEEIKRAAELGFRSVLIADLGVLRLFSAMRDAGELPPDMQAKISVMLPAANPASARVLEDLGANTINVPVDLSLAQLAAIRAAIDVPLDVYVESPDNLGGIVRLHEISEIVRVTAPVHVKFGLRNAPDLYPSGSHLEATAVALSRERVRRARIGLDRLTIAGV